MSEIVYNETVQCRPIVGSHTRGQIATDTKYTIFARSGKVAVVKSTLVCGVPYKAPKKRYYYWQSVASFGLRRNANGNIVPFQCSRPFDAKVGTKWKHTLAVMPWLLLNSEAESSDNFYFNWRIPDTFDIEAMTQAYREAVDRSLQIRSIEEVYPMMRPYGLTRYDVVPTSLRPGFRANNWQDFVAASFGKTRTTPRLVAAVQNTEPYITAFAQQFRGLVPDEELVSYIEDNHFDEDMYEHFKPHSPNIRHGLLRGTPENVKSIWNMDMTFPLSERVRIFSAQDKRSLEWTFQRMTMHENVVARVKTTLANPNMNLPF